MCSLDGYDDVTKLFNVSIILPPAFCDIFTFIIDIKCDSVFVILNKGLFSQLPWTKSKHCLIAYRSIFMIISENENGYMTEKSDYRIFILIGIYFLNIDKTISFCSSFQVFTAFGLQGDFHSIFTNVVTLSWSE